MTTDDGILARVALKFRQGVCGLHGHDALLHFGKSRMSLVCTSCGHESPGWDLRESATRAHATSRAARPAVTPLPTHVAAYRPERRVA